MSLVSLPHLRRKDTAYSLTVPAYLRARAGNQIRDAVAAGRITRDELSLALESGDAGLSELMYRHHRLHGDVVLPAFNTPTTLTQESTQHLIAWAKHLRDANKISNARLLEIPEHNAMTDLLELCVAASTPDVTAELDLLPAPPADNANRHVYFQVSTSYIENIVGRHYEHSTAQTDFCTVFIEPVNIPHVTLPELDCQDDTIALMSAVDALANEAPCGLINAPRHFPEITDGWFVELLTDAARTAKLRDDGTPILTVAHCEAMAEEMGLEYEENPEATCRKLEAHYAHLRALHNATIWKPNSQHFKKWLKANQGKSIHGLVTRLLAIALKLKKISIKQFDVDIEYDGDCIGLMIAAPTPSDLDFFNSLDTYGENEIPQMKLTMCRATQIPSAFWRMHESVLMTMSLITEAANAITTYENNIPSSR